MGRFALEISKLSKKISQKVSTPSIIAEVLREAILTGKLQPGERVVETKIAQELGIGQPTVREALVLLEHEGLLVRRLNKGCSVIELSQREIDQIFRVRLELEPLAVELAKEAWNEQKSAVLLEALRKLTTAAQEGDAEKYYRYDLRFHQELWGLADNPFLEKSLSQITVPLFSFAMIEVTKAPRFDIKQNAEAHQRIAEAVLNPAIRIEDAKQITRDILKGFLENGLFEYVDRDL